MIAVGETPITAAQIDAFLPTIALIEPHLVESDHRRKAFANISLQIAVAQELLPTERDAAFLVAQTWNQAARETGSLPDDAAEPAILTGGWNKVGMVAWAEAMDLEAGTYSRLFETPGSWTFIKVIATSAEPGEPFGPKTTLTIQRYDVPFLDKEVMRDVINGGIDELPITIVDPEWEPIVPPIYLYPKSTK